ncbi:pectate lyase [Nonomuraea ferruginea]
MWWNDVGEDAATFRSSSSSAAYLVDGGGAKSASDKVFQHNGAGTLTIRNFQVHSAKQALPGLRQLLHLLPAARGHGRHHRPFHQGAGRDQHQLG